MEIHLHVVVTLKLHRNLLWMLQFPTRGYLLHWCGTGCEHDDRVHVPIFGI
jgi:hypothetical protein